MGASTSVQNSKQAIESLSQSTFEEDNVFTSVAECKTSGVNNMYLALGTYPDKPGSTKECAKAIWTGSNIKAGQRVVSQCVIDSTVTMKSKQTLVDKINNEMEQLMKQNKADKGGDFWARLGITVDVQNSDNLVKMQNLISSKIKNDFDSRCVSTATGENGLTAYLCGDFTGATVTFDQSLIITAAAKCTADLVTEAFKQDDVINNAVQKTDQSNTTTGIIYYIIIGVIAVAFIGLLVWIVRANAASKGVNLTERGAEQIGPAGTLPPPAPTRTEVAMAAVAKLP